MKKLMHSSEDFLLEKLHKHLRIDEEMKHREKSESAEYSKANSIIGKENRKHDGMKNHFVPKKEHNKFKNSGELKGPKGKGYSVEGMIKLYTTDNIINEIPNCAYMLEYTSLWKSRLEHIDISTMNRLIKYDLISCNIYDFEKCEKCVKSKMIKKPFKSVERKSNLLDLVHSNLCEFNAMLTRGGNRYFIIFIDDFSRFTHVYLLKHKDDDFNAFKIYKAEVENQLSRSIKVLRSDKGGEYFSTLMYIMKNMTLYMKVSRLDTTTKWFSREKESNISRNDKCYVNAF
ncbi:uncharacterized protein LOC127122307 [Lathyrus oleraceus]|uniref:uncharacterized protein LOC127122307 n=1 Tax=Pisum sativum TaxID=3888 RepID=UPI0021CEB42C|nr:uncharacterized protein LOC127122307 [Pisum sativum]